MVKYWFIYESMLCDTHWLKYWLLHVKDLQILNLKHKIPEGCRREKRGQVVIFEALSKSTKGILFLKIADKRWAWQKIL